MQRLEKLSLISAQFTPPEVVDASGRRVSASGVIELEWKWHPRGTRNHVCQFYVFPQSDYLDVVFGVEYIESENLILVNEAAFVTLVEHKKSNEGESAPCFQSCVSSLRQIPYIY